MVEPWVSTLWEEFCSALLNSSSLLPTECGTLDQSLLYSFSGDFEGYNPIPSSYTY